MFIENTHYNICFLFKDTLNAYYNYKRITSNYLFSVPFENLRNYKKFIFKYFIQIKMAESIALLDYLHYYFITYSYR